MCRCNKCKRKRNLSGTSDNMPGTPPSDSSSGKWAWVGGALSSVGGFLANDNTWKVANNAIDIYTRLDNGGAQYNASTGQVSPIWNFTPQSNNNGGGGGGGVKAGFDTNETVMMVGAAAVVVYLIARK
jgi:hypothetical protein